MSEYYKIKINGVEKKVRVSDHEPNHSMDRFRGKNDIKFYTRSADNRQLSIEDQVTAYCENNDIDIEVFKPVLENWSDEAKELADEKIRKLEKEEENTIYLEDSWVTFSKKIDIATEEFKINVDTINNDDDISDLEKLNKIDEIKEEYKIIIDKIKEDHIKNIQNYSSNVEFDIDNLNEWIKENKKINLSKNPNQQNNPPKNITIIVPQNKDFNQDFITIKKTSTEILNQHTSQIQKNTQIQENTQSFNQQKNTRGKKRTTNNSQKIAFIKQIPIDDYLKEKGYIPTNQVITQNNGEILSLYFKLNDENIVTNKNTPNKLYNFDTGKYYNIIELEQNLSNTDENTAIQNLLPLAKKILGDTINIPLSEKPIKQINTKNQKKGQDKEITM